MVDNPPTFAHIDRIPDGGGTIELGILRNASYEFIGQLRRYLRHCEDHALSETLGEIRRELNKVYDEFEGNQVAGAPLKDILGILEGLDGALDALDRYRVIVSPQENLERASVAQRDKAEDVRVARRRALLQALEQVGQLLR